MKVSIITATYNSDKSLQCAIDSVKAQDYPDIEYIIIDGGSTDSTLSIIEANNEVVTSFISENDNGIYDALNKGIKMSTGHIVGFLNSDDALAQPTIISRIVESFISNASDVVYGDLMYVNNSKDCKPIRYWKSNEFDITQLKYGWMPPHPTVYCKKGVYDKFGGYNQEFKISGDFDFTLRVFKQKNVKKTYLPITMVIMGMGGVSNNSLANLIKKYREDYRALRNNNMGGIFAVFCKNARKILQFGALLPSSTK